MKQPDERYEPVTALIVDDEEDGRDLLEGLLAELGYVKVVGKAEDAEHGTNLFLLHNPDLLFIDIRMPGKDGLTMVEDINKLNLYPSVIFVTAYDQYAIQAIRKRAFDYLLKPVDQEALRNAIQRFLGSEKYKEKLGLQKNITPDPGGSQSIKIHTRTGFHVIHPVEIVYLQAEGNYSQIYLQNEEQIFTSVNLGKLLEEMPDFIQRISRSVAVNRKYISEVDKKDQLCKLSWGKSRQYFHISREHIRELEEDL
jgi:DNA-binding LytR/AlgR family response regulator